MILRSSDLKKVKKSPKTTEKRKGKLIGNITGKKNMLEGGQRKIQGEKKDDPDRGKNQNTISCLCILKGNTEDSWRNLFAHPEVPHIT